MFDIKNKIAINLLLLTVIIVYSIPLQADIIPLEGLKKAERQLYGNNSEAAILEKINTIEFDIFGHKTKGSLAERAQGIIDYVFLADKAAPSLVLILPYMEWTLYNQIKDGNMISRIENIEMSIFGEIQEGALVTRINKLTGLLIPIENTLFKEISVPEGMEIHIKIEEEINTADLKAGKLIKYEIPDDIKIDEYLIIPAGTKGDLIVTEFNKAGNFGKDAELKISINDIKTLDASNLSLNLKSSNKESNSKEIAVGVSLLSTIIVSNPVGLVAGYFLKGKDIVIPEGTVMRTQVMTGKEVYGVKVQK